MWKKNRRPLQVVCGSSPTTAAAAAVAAAATTTTTTTTTTSTSKKRRHSAPEGKSQRQRTEPPSPAPPHPVPPSPAPPSPAPPSPAPPSPAPPSPAPFIPTNPSTPTDLLPPPLPHQPFAFPQPHHHHHHHHPSQVSNPPPTFSITPSPTQSPTTLVPVSTALLHSTSATTSTSVSTSTPSPTHITLASSAPGARRSVRGLVQGALDWYAGKMSLRAKSGKFKGIANDANNHHDVVKRGYLRKLKTNRRKFFVLRSDTGHESPARIEYYESENKFITGAQPKKQIILKDCFNINRKADPKQSCVIALFTDRDCLCIVAESEEELSDWLHNLHRHQKTSEDTNHVKPSYEHVWQVVVHPKGLGSTRPITGQRRICLTCRSLSLVESNQSKIEFPLNMIRRCGYSGIFFYIEVGRLAMTGPGHLWMETEDAIIAQNMYSVIRTAMQDHGGSFDDDVASSRLQQQHSADQDGQGSTRHRTTSFSTQPRPCTEGFPSSSRRDRSGSMPSRSRTSSEGSSLTTKPGQGVGSTPNHHHHHHHHHHPVNPSAHNRPHSMYSPPLSASCSPPCVLPMHSPNSYSSESMESSVSAEDLDNSQRCDSLAGLEDDHLSFMEVAPSPSLTPLPAGPSQPPQSLQLSSHLSHKPILPGMLSPAGMDKCSSPPEMGSYMMMNSPTDLQPAGTVSSTPGYLVMLPGNPPITTSASSSMGSAGSGAGNESGYLHMESPGVMPSSSSSWSPINRALLSSSSHIKSPPSAPTSASHSRSSSQVEDMTEGYLLMNLSAPSSASDTPTGLPRERSDGYVDMTPTAALPRPIPGTASDGDSFPEMSPGSSSSFTSGTPSDHRFQDFSEKGVSGFYGSEDDESASSMDRPVRANSVGSKPEQFRSRKNRLEASDAGDLDGASRVRAFSVGSRVGLQPAGGGGGGGGCGGGGGAGGSGGSGAGGAGRLQPLMGGWPTAGPPFPASLQDRGNQAKTKSNSAPILGSSPISNSWSGTPGVFFKGFLQARSQERYHDLMEIDLSKNKSCDSISNVKDKKKSSSIESLKRTITGHRHRSNSKSSGSGKTSVFDSLKREKKKSESEPKVIEPPFSLQADKFCEMEFSRSPRRNTSEHIEGYLKMNPSTGSISSSSCDYMDMEPDMDHLDGKAPGVKDRHAAEGYVDMGQLSYSSGTTSSSTSSSSASRVRKLSHCFNPLSSHHDISSPLEEYTTVDLSLDASSQSLEGDKGRKKDKKNSRKKSKDSTKRKKSDPIAVQSRSREGGGSDLPSWESFKNKGTSPLSSISNFLTRKNSSGTPPKTPLSPTGSPLPKSNRGTPSPFSSLTRSKSRDSGSSSSKGAAVVDKEALGSGAMVVGVEEAIKEGEESPTNSYMVIAAGSSGVSGVSGSAALLGGGPSALRGGSGSETTLTVPKCDSSLLHASVVGGVGGASRRSSGVLLEAEEEDKTSQEEETAGAGSYVNLVPGVGVGGPALVSSGGAVCSGAMAAVPEEGQQGRQNTSALAVPPDTLRMPSLLPTVCDVPSSSHDYVNLCPGRKLPHRSPSLSRDKQAVSGDAGAVTMAAVAAGGSGGGWSAAGRSKVPTRDDHDYMLIMPGGKTEGVSEASKGSQGPEVPCKGTGEAGPKGLGEVSKEPCDANKGLSEASKGASEASKVKGLVKKPEIPKLLLLNRSEQRHAPADLASALQRVNLGTGIAGGGGSSAPVSSERSRSHSGPGAPEGSAMSGESRMVGTSKRSGEARHASGGDTVGGKAASACSSPVSYSPPTSPTLRGSMSSVSSLSESGMSSASSTCTVVNVGLAASRRDPGQSPHPLQDQQQQPPSPCPIPSAVPPVGANNQQPSGPVAAASAATASVVTSAPAAEATTTAVAAAAPTPALDNLNYASLDLAPAKCEGVMPSPRATRRTTSSSSSGGGGGPSAMMEEELQEEGGEALSYAQIDFTKSEGLSITRRHASRH